MLVIRIANVFQAFTEIDFDSGAVNRFEPQRVVYEVPPPFDAELEQCEDALARLGGASFGTFCAGEWSEIQAMITRDPELKLAERLLNAYFEGFADA